MEFRESDSLATHASLLERLKDLDDQGSWQEFYGTYRKLIFSFALRHGMTPTEAEEVVQETVIAVARNVGEFRYDPARCAFKTWLLNLTRWRIQDQLRKRRPEGELIPRTPGGLDRTATVEAVAAPEDRSFEAIWDAEWEKHLFARALGRLKARVDEKQFQVFDLYAVRGWPVSEVARDMGVSRARVYLIKHRLAALLKKELRQLQAREKSAGDCCITPRIPKA